MKDMQALERKIAQFLRIGVALSGSLMLIGWLMKFKFSGNPFYNFQVYDRIPFPELFKFYVTQRDYGVLVSFAGLFTLISIPLIRVVLTAYIFFRQREFALAWIAVLVLTGLFVSMALGIDL